MITNPCKKRVGAPRKPYGEASFHALYARYLYDANKRGRVFNLTKDESKKLFTGDCFYCGAKPANISSHPHWYGSFTYNGIDRLDNNLGYISENCVSCCKICNFLKNSQSYDDFIKWVKKVYTHNN